MLILGARHFITLLVVFSFWFATSLLAFQDNEQQVITMCRAVDAGISAMSDEVNFIGEFRLRSEWHETHVLNPKNFNGFDNDTFGVMEAADGQMFIEDHLVNGNILY